MTDGLAASDRLLARLAFQPEHIEPAPIPWPDGLAPAPIGNDASAGGPLPAGDVLVVTWTAAEFMALADVLTPGNPSTDWAHYTENWAAYVPQLTGRSPAKAAARLGEYALTQIGTKRVVCFHSQLHLATDGPEPPIVQLWQQIIPEVNPQLVITTGTAGGIGLSTSLGDVFVVSNAKFNCTKTFASKPWAQERFVGTPLPAPAAATDTYLTEAQKSLLPVNAGHLRPLATRDPEVGVGGDVETVDYFGFADTDDSYGIAKNDPLAHTEEMDDATLPLALSLVTAPAVANTPWLSVRNASDPEVSSSIGNLEAQAKWASEIYQKYGYWTTVGSAIVCWALVADL
jgi:nucleoside phosphorylase